MLFCKFANRSLPLSCLAVSLLALPATAQKTSPVSVSGSSFAPAAPVGHASALPGLPAVQPSDLHSAQPSLFMKEQRGEVLTQAQRAVREADRHFQYGKFFIQEGKSEEARREFDLAIDTLLDTPENLPDRALVDRKFEEMVRRIHRYDLESLGSGTSPNSPVYTLSPLNEILDLTFPIDPRLKDKSLAQAQSSQTQLPLVVNDAVLSYINYFTSQRGRKTLTFGLKRAGRYREMISRILTEEGVPQELIHLAQAESGFMPRALSPKAAAGMWQFVRARGQEYGLEAGTQVDERLDPEKATRAAARHLRDLYNQLGDWYLAMAAYNCGPYCVDRAVQRTGYADYWELRKRNAIPKETRNYVPAILAMAIVSRDLEAYGIDPVEAEPSMEFESIEIEAPTSIALIADAADVPLTEIRELNPALLRNVAPAGYDMRVPKDRAQTVASALDSVPEERRASWRLHRVASGDTLASIARQYSTAATSIIAANQHKDSEFFDAPEDGEVLLIPASAKPEVVKRGKGHSPRVSASRKSSSKTKTVRVKSSKKGKTHVATARPKSRAVAR